MNDKIPITKLISAACRNFMGLKGMHHFEFKDGTNYLVDSSGGSIFGLIIQSLMPPEKVMSITSSCNTKAIKGIDSMADSNQSLLELKFIAGGKVHFLRKVVLDQEDTIDFHLYIDEGVGTKLLLDEDAIEYINNLEFEGITNVRSGMKFDANAMNEIWELLADNKLFLDVTNREISDMGADIKLVNARGGLSAKRHDGSLLNLDEDLMIEIIAASSLGRIKTMFDEINISNKSRVILLYDLFAFDIYCALSEGLTARIMSAIEIMAVERNCQLFISSPNYTKGIVPVASDKIKIPEFYNSNNKLINQLAKYDKFKKYLSVVELPWKR